MLFLGNIKFLISSLNLTFSDQVAIKSKFISSLRITRILLNCLYNSDIYLLSITMQIKWLLKFEP